MTATELPLTLSTEEHEYLRDLLERALKHSRVEEHRTRTPSYRQHVLREADLIEGLLTKLGQAPG